MIYTIAFDSKHNMAIGGKSSSNPDFVHDSDYHTLPFAMLIDSNNDVVWGKQFNDIKARIVDLEFNEAKKKLMVMFGPDMGIFIVIVDAATGEALKAYSQIDRFGSYTNFGSQSRYLPDESIFLLFSDEKDFHLLKFKETTSAEKNLKWYGKVPYYPSNRTFLGQVLEFGDSERDLYLGGSVFNETVKNPAIMKLEYDGDQSVEFKWTVSHLQYQNQSMMISDGTNSSYSITKLQVYSDDGQNYVFGCAQPAQYAQNIILLKTSIDNGLQSPREMLGYYFSHSEVYSNPGDKCRGLHVQDQNTATLIYESPGFHVAFFIARVDLFEMQVVVAEANNFLEGYYQRMQQVVFISQYEAFYVGKLTDVTSLTWNVELSQGAGFVMSLDPYQSYLEYSYTKQSIEVFQVEATVLNTTSPFSKLSYDDKDLDIPDINVRTELVQDDLYLDNDVIALKKGFHITPNSEQNQIPDTTYIIGSGVLSLTIELSRPSGCNMNSLLLSTLESGKPLPTFVAFFSQNNSYLINSTNDSLAGAYSIKVKEVLKQDNKVTDDSLVWNLYVLSSEFGSLTDSKQPPYFAEPLIYKITLYYYDTYVYELPAIISPAGNEIIKDISYENEAIRFTKINQEKLFVFPQSDYIGNHSISIILLDKSLGLSSELYTILIEVLSKPAEPFTPDSDPDDPEPEVPEVVQGQYNYSQLQKDMTAEIREVTMVGLLTIDLSEKLKPAANLTKFLADLYNILNVQIYCIKDGWEKVPFTDFNWTYEYLQGDQLQLKLNIYDPLQIQNNNSAQFYVQVKFIKIEYFISENLEMLNEDYWVLTEKLPSMLADDKLSQGLEKMMPSLQLLVGLVFGGSFLSNMLLSSSMSYFWGYINVLQIILHMPLLIDTLPSNAQILFQTLLSFSNFDFLPLEDFIDRVFSFEEEEALSVQFEELSYESRLVIENLSSTFLYLVLMGIATGAFYLLMKIRFTWKVFMFLYQQASKFLTTSFYYRFFLETYLELVICSHINTLSYSFHNASYGINSLLAIALLLLTFLFLVYIFYLIYKNHQRLQQVLALADATKANKAFFQRHEALYENLKLEDALPALYTFVFVLRRFTLSLTAVYAPVLQISLFQIQTLLVLTYLVYFRPFLERFDNSLEIFNEASIFVISLHMFLCNDNLEDVGARYKLGWSIIMCVLINIAVNNVVLVAQMVQGIVKTFKWLVQKLKDRKNKRFLFYLSNRSSQNQGNLSSWRMFNVQNKTIFEDPSLHNSRDHGLSEIEMQSNISIDKSHSHLYGRVKIHVAEPEQQQHQQREGGKHSGSSEENPDSEAPLQIIEEEFKTFELPGMVMGGEQQQYYHRKVSKPKKKRRRKKKGQNQTESEEAEVSDELHVKSSAESKGSKGSKESNESKESQW